MFFTPPVKPLAILLIISPAASITTPTVSPTPSAKLSDFFIFSSPLAALPTSFVEYDTLDSEVSPSGTYNIISVPPSSPENRFAPDLPALLRLGLILKTM